MSSDDEVKTASPLPPLHMDGESQSDLLRQMMVMMQELKQENGQLRGQVAQFQATQSRMEGEVREVRRLNRRQSRLLSVAGPATPIPSPPQVSSMTNSAYAGLHTPVPRQVNQAGGRHSEGGRSLVEVINEEGEADLDDEDANDSAEEEEVKESPLSGVDEEKEAMKLAKVMSKRAAPTAFYGEKEVERENVESWVIDANEYLDSQFGQLKGKHHKQRLQLIRSYIKGAAANWVNAAVQTDPTQTWESLQKPFIEFIRGGRESRTLYLEKMKTLTYGKGNCKDLLKLEQEFEQLRIKLYPSSSTVPEVNEIVGREYAEAIRRGDLDLYLEMLRIIGGNDQPKLSEWKAAAVKAHEVRALQAFAKKQAEGHGGKQKWAHNNRFGGLAVQGMNTEGGNEGQQEGPADHRGEGQTGADVNQLQGRRGGGSWRPRRSSFLLPDDEYRTVMEKGLCLQCYKPDHRIQDCKEQGKPKRRPTKEELSKA